MDNVGYCPVWAFVLAFLAVMGAVYLVDLLLGHLERRNRK